jgi:hypothetical protein
MQKLKHIQRPTERLLSGAWSSRGFYAINPVDSCGRWGLEC